MQTDNRILLPWVSPTSVLSVLLFGDAQSLTRHSGRRSEFTLILLATLSGWLDGLFAMFVFRHKTAKRFFQFEYAASFLVSGGWVCARFTHR